MRTCDLARLEALLVQLFGHVVVGDGAEQAAVHAGFLGQLEVTCGELLAQRLGFGQLGSGHFFEFGAAGFEFGDGAWVARRARPVGIRKLRA
jgi:hypothetical protein